MDYINETTETLAEMERAAYITGDTRAADMLAAVMEGVIAIDAADDVETLADEQSESRRALLEEIVEKCSRASRYSRFKETKELASSILTAVSDSYVEL